MGDKNRAEVQTESSLNEDMLFATMCMIGFPVDVHIRDGSIYSGTFHTASFDKEYDVVLKKAKLTKKGNCDANVPDGSVIETLVILSRDIVQVVAKEVLFPPEAVTGNMSVDDVEVAVTDVPSSEDVASEAKKSNKFTSDKKETNRNRQIEADWSQEEQDHCKQKFELGSEKSASEAQNSNSILPVVDVTSESHSSLAASTDVVSSQSLESNRSSKEIKLNPEAKSFSPSFANPVSVSPPAVPGVASMTYVPCDSPMVPVSVAQPEVGLSPYAPQILGHMGSRTQPIRYGGHYYVAQSGPAYVPPNSQAVMVGRQGQLVYMQPVPYDLVQSTAAMPYPHQVQYPKHQGIAAGQASPFCLPALAGGQQLFAMPSHYPLLQPPIPANHPFQVQRSNAPSNTKSP